MEWDPITLTYTEPLDDIVSKTHWETEFKKLIDASNSVHTAVNTLNNAYENLVATALADIISGFSIVHNDLSNRDAVNAHPTAAVTGLDTALADLAAGIAEIAAGNIKPDWNAAPGADAEILNKPTLITALANMSASAASRHLTDTYIAILDRKTTTAYGTAAVSDAVFQGVAGYAAKNGDIYIKHA